MTPINNSRMGRIPPDVEPETSPLVDRLLALIARFGEPWMRFPCLSPRWPDRGP
jgi:hypothetical protein